MRFALALLGRGLAATLGGYALASLVAVAFAAWLPMARADAALSGMFAAVVVQTCAALWTFAARSLLWAWGGLLLPGLPLGVALSVAGLVPPR